nr:MAG TPA: hypothetical protein [Crassvirales sp.]
MKVYLLLLLSNKLYIFSSHKVKTINLLTR